ncbi:MULTISPECIES: uroporphyrinogen decarboxylase family protein [Clostridium]|uniref:Methylcobalamin:coenzyme M methyltransferase n=1 Tax=Clostridium ragsdalei P11 TaxID=1353534 RepID=A0A1A6B1Q1_9CLOT|nr:MULTISPECIES: uroporphyrinogen decarboxylase family protein [Clostridium]OBR96210.1 methylcobalamin:coenzyme M methyltransferase [Clostridium ragsdalei P11]QXE18676.1 uroporphyrinogen-III decarboxylase [Clostridium sp. 001]
MKTGQSLYDEHLDRYMKTVALMKTDRTPVMINGDSFCAKHMGVKLSDFVSNLQLSCDTIFNSVSQLGDVDGCASNYANPLMFSFGLLSHVKLPGKELPDNQLWQVVEAENLNIEDYDTILSKGWNNFLQDFLENRLKLDFNGLKATLDFAPKAAKKFENAGYIAPTSAFMGNVTEHISFGRSLSKFIRDLYKMPDKVEAVLNVIQEEEIAQLKQQLEEVKKNKKQPPIMLGGSCRGASEFFTPKLWERFIWKYMKEATDVAIEAGFKVMFHVDSNWTRDLEYFTAFPKGSCIFESDGITDKEKFLKLLGGRMCFKGDVPAQMLVLATPDEVYNYCTKLIKDFDGTGLILSSGCTIPFNAKVENVKAMVSAATGK